MQTSLIGRKVINSFADDRGEIVAVYLDRGTLTAMVENCEGRCYTANVETLHLEKQ